ncbi:MULTISPECIES: radical SAM family heme chaperone HemW [unclassified Bartonella]|uniref:radical SAM family heme chaperone HemW n=1 Tax=unclassified Bartonella TaxID=2645622 RepID=UPI00099AFD8A|nr:MULTISPECIES: radical SAM family heme chaperone HemW [unclassified Bartonella]AQX28643.1 coproporphyrinogen III oxidase, anaerobic [Bartonella sp. JB15]AQX29899.1 coproporphyrinogen III oxidase, anaerobic [Bartonella sp. JB63]
MTKPFGIYIHWPFCVSKCPYCDFNSYVRINGVDQPRFAAAFEREMTTQAHEIGLRHITSIFIGGGTPSLMTPQTVDRLLQAIAKNWTIDDKAEITLEANPSSVEANRFRDYHLAGVNRLSLGVQALNNKALHQLGRLHDVKQALYAINLAREIFPRLSFDLIYARPKQTLKQWESELLQAINLAADHLSLYQLTIEDGTTFKKLHTAGKLILPASEQAANLYTLTQEITTMYGLPAYEISNHAIPGAESCHNLLYWRYHEYAGFGPGAHGRFIKQPLKNSSLFSETLQSKTENHNRYVTINEKHPENWLKLVETKGHGCIDTEQLTQEQQANEMLLMGLRLSEGLNLTRYETLSHRSLSPKKLISLQQQGLVEMTSNQHLKATTTGRILLDHIICQLAN